MYLAEKFSQDDVEQTHSRSLEHIRKTSPWMYSLLKAVTRVFLSIDFPKGYSKAGFSSNFAKGFVFMNYASANDEESVFETAVDYVHESSHQLIFLIGEVDPIIKGDPKKMVYSGIKGCERPAILTLHGAVALSHMCLFRIFHKKAMGHFVHSSEENLKRDMKKLNQTLMDLTEKCEFTEVGERIINDLKYVSRLSA